MRLPAASRHLVCRRAVSLFHDNRQQLARLNSSHTHSIVRCYLAEWVWCTGRE
jgi:hypothetical protein